MDLQPAHAAPITNTDVALQRLGGDTALFSTLLSYFLQDSPGLMQKLHDAHHSGAHEIFVQTVHGLKGLAATFEAVPFVAVAREIETAARAGNWSMVETLLPQLDSEFDRLRNEIELLAR